MEYEFGAGSTKYKMIANNDDVAFFTIMMFYHNPSLPIAIYKPFNKVVFGKDIVGDDYDSFMSENADELKKAHESIKEIIT